MKTGEQMHRISHVHIRSAVVFFGLLANLFLIIHYKILANQDRQEVQIDLGNVKPGQKLIVNFEVHNPSKKDVLYYDKMNNMCSCTDITHAEAIEPGKKDTLKMTVNIPDGYGQLERKLLLSYKYANGHRKDVLLLIKGVRPPRTSKLICSNEILQLGDIKKGTCFKRQIAIYREDESLINFKSLVSSTGITAEIDPCLSRDNLLVISVEVDTGKLNVGELNENLTVITEQCKI